MKTKTRTPRPRHATPLVEDPIYRIADTVAATGLSRSGIYSRIKDRTFPAPLQLGPRAIGWRKSTVDAWLAERELAA